jgi:hypothetical protein
MEEQHETCPKGAMHAVLPDADVRGKGRPGEGCSGRRSAAYQSPAPVESGDQDWLGETFQREKVSAQEQRAGKGNNVICPYMQKANLHTAMPGCIILIY